MDFQNQICQKFVDSNNYNYFLCRGKKMFTLSYFNICFNKLFINTVYISVSEQGSYTSLWGVLQIMRGGGNDKLFYRSLKKQIIKFVCHQGSTDKQRTTQSSQI